MPIVSVTLPAVEYGSLQGAAKWNVNVPVGIVAPASTHGSAICRWFYCVDVDVTAWTCPASWAVCGHRTAAVSLSLACNKTDVIPFNFVWGLTEGSPLWALR